jgi:hypothetical protein
MKKLIIAVAILAPLVGVWIFYGRFAVEGGKAPWAIINERSDVLKEAVKTASQKEKDDALSRAASKERIADMRVLLKAGANPEGDRQPAWCILKIPGPEVISVLLEAGADPARCDKPGELMAQFIESNRERGSEQELIQVLRQLIDRGLKPDPESIAAAEKHKLAEVAAFLKDPASAKVIDPASIPKAARLGDNSNPDRDDLKKICDGEGLAKLPAYQKQPGALSPVIYFEKRLEGDWRWPGQLLPRWWSTFDDLSHTQVVACVRVVDKKVAQECRYQGGGGGVNIYDATFEIFVRDAKTGKILSQKTAPLKATSTRCPFIKFGKQSEGQYPDYTAELKSLVEPLLK